MHFSNAIKRTVVNGEVMHLMWRWLSRRGAAPCWASNWYESDLCMYEIIGENVSQQFNKRLQLISEGLKCRATRRTAIQLLRNIHGKKQWNTHNFQSAVYRTQQHKKRTWKTLRVCHPKRQAEEEFRKKRAMCFACSSHLGRPSRRRASPLAICIFDCFEMCDVLFEGVEPGHQYNFPQLFSKMKILG